jgi:hypothetical protein
MADEPSMQILEEEALFSSSQQVAVNLLQLHSQVVQPMPAPLLAIPCLPDEWCPAISYFKDRKEVSQVPMVYNIGTPEGLINIFHVPHTYS